MAMHKFDLALNRVLDEVFRAFSDEELPIDRYATVMAFTVMTLSLGLLLELYLQCTIRLRMIWLALATGDMTEDAIIDWISNKALSILQGWILAKVMQATRRAAVRAFAWGRRRWFGAR